MEFRNKHIFFQSALRDGWMGGWIFDGCCAYMSTSGIDITQLLSSREKVEEKRYSSASSLTLIVLECSAPIGAASRMCSFLGEKTGKETICGEQGDVGLKLIPGTYVGAPWPLRLQYIYPLVYG